MSLVEMATAAPQAVARPAAVRALSTLAGAALAVGPVIGFVIQAREVQSTGRLRGFSPGVCLLLLVAHILRIFFWIFRQFDIALLWQSCLMIAVMLWLLSLCVSAQRQVALEHRVPLRRLRNFRLSDFWRWDAFNDYLIVLCGFFMAVCCLCLVVSAYGHTAVLAEVLGGLAVAFEVAFPVPQMRKILVTGSSAGVRWEMVATWWVGDVLKTAYFVISEAPLQFFLCGLLQMMLDTVLAGQLVLYYRNDPAPAAPDAATKASPLALVKLPTMPSLAAGDGRGALVGLVPRVGRSAADGAAAVRGSGGGSSAAKHG